MAAKQRNRTVCSLLLPQQKLSRWVTHRKGGYTMLRRESRVLSLDMEDLNEMPSSLILMYILKEEHAIRSS